MNLPCLILAASALILSSAQAADLTPRQAQLLANNCVQCHARADIGAPVMGTADDWKTRRQQGEEVLLKNVVEGVRGMPPFGYCSACSEQDLRALIRFMAGLPGPTYSTPATSAINAKGAAK